MPCFIAPLSLLSRPTAAPRAELGPPLMAGDTGSDVRPARLSCSETVTLSESRHLWVCSSPARRGAGASPQGGPECQTGPRGDRETPGQAFHKGPLSTSMSQSRTGGRQGHAGSQRGFPACPGQSWPPVPARSGALGLEQSLGFFALPRLTRGGWRWTLCLTGPDETHRDGQAVP